MKINFTINDELKNFSIISFLESYKFNFLSLEKFYKFNGIKFLILNKNISDENLSDILEKVQVFKTQIIAHKILKEKIGPKYNVIFYPIKISIFENILEKYYQRNIFFEDVFLSQDNFLINSINKKKIYVTEKEFEILNIFFKEKKVKKIKILEDILKLQKNLDTKSLEAHISRIRSKLLKIDSNLNIVALNDGQLKIKKLI